MMWKETIFKPGIGKWQGGEFVLSGYHRMPGGWINRKISQLAQNNEVWQGSVFYERLTDPFSTTNVETEILSIKINNFINKYNLRKDSLMMDAGCADGRITHLLLKAGVRRIVSTDLDQINVNRLMTSLKPGQQENVLAIVDDFNDLPIADGMIDVLIPSALLAEMPDFQAALQSAMRMLKPGGVMFYFDPVLEHSLVYALVRNDLDEFLKIAETSTRARMWDQKERRYPVGTAHELEQQLLMHPEVEIMERDGISILPSLVFGGLLQDVSVGTEKKQQLKDIIISMSGRNLQIYRQIIFICRKKDQCN